LSLNSKHKFLKVIEEHKDLLTLFYKNRISNPLETELSKGLYESTFRYSKIIRVSDEDKGIEAL
jgi:hypothetical protein